MLDLAKADSAGAGDHMQSVLRLIEESEADCTHTSGTAGDSSHDDRSAYTPTLIHVSTLQQILEQEALNRLLEAASATRQNVVLGTQSCGDGC